MHLRRSDGRRRKKERPSRIAPQNGGRASDAAVDHSLKGPSIRRSGEARRRRSGSRIFGRAQKEQKIELWNERTTKQGRAPIAVAPPGITHSLSLMMAAFAPPPPPLPLPPLKVALFCRDCRCRLLWPPASLPQSGLWLLLVGRSVGGGKGRESEGR